MTTGPLLLVLCVMLATAVAPLAVRAADGDDPAALTARQALDKMAAGELSSAALIDALIGRAVAKDGLNAFIHLDTTTALEDARAADAARLAGDRTEVQPLLGLPIVLKDNIVVAGRPTTGGTGALSGFVAGRSAPVAQRLIDAGAVVLGKTNMHELAFGITSNNARFGAVGNAYSPDHSAGGSSGGTGAAIGARMAPAGLGTDTGGSVRIPAALNGIAGLRPTVGRYPQDGIVPISSTRDTAGPMARTVDDLVLLDGVITEAPLTIEPAAIGEVRLGVPRAFNDNVSAEVAAARDAALAKLEAAGATLVPLEMTGIFALNEKVGFPVALYEVGRDLPAFLERWETGVSLDEVVAGLASPDVAGVFGQFVVGDQKMPEAAYRAAVETFRPRLQEAYAETFARDKLDAIVFPTTPLAAPPITGSDETVELDGERLPTFLTYIRNTDPGSNAGLPGLTIPIGLDSRGLPIGLAFDGPAFSDRNLLAVGLAAEAVLGPIPPPVD